jgi:hypothetical protein
MNTNIDIISATAGKVACVRYKLNEYRKLTPFLGG